MRMFDRKGLRRPEVMAQYARRAARLYVEWGPRTTRREVGLRLVAAVADQLTRFGVVAPAPVIGGTNGDLGQFDYEAWALRLNAGQFRGRSKPDLAEYQDMVDTVYHEGRHCEQWFLMARAMAGHWDATHIRQEMSIPVMVATHAKAKPIKHDRAFQDGRAFFVAVYGGDRDHRDTTLADLGSGDPAAFAQYRHLIEEQDAWGAGEGAAEQFNNVIRVVDRGRSAQARRQGRTHRCCRDPRRVQANRTRQVRHGLARREKLAAVMRNGRAAQRSRRR